MWEIDKHNALSQKMDVIFPINLAVVLLKTYQKSVHKFIPLKISRQHFLPPPARSHFSEPLAPSLAT